MHTNEEDGLPPAIAAAWGLRPLPAKGPKRAFTIGQIVETAVQIALDEGFSAVSMNRVAAALDTTGMSLYRYFSAKEELLDLMVDHAVGPPPSPPDADWRTALHDWALAQLTALRTHPWIVEVPISGPPITPNGVSWFDHGLRCLSGTSLDEGEKILVIQLVGSHVRGIALLQAQGADARTSRYGGTLSDLALMSRVIDERRFPAVFTALQTSAMDIGEGTPDDLDYDFEFGLNRILDGIETFIQNQGPPPS